MSLDLIIGTAVLALLLALEGVAPFYLGRRQRLRHGLRNGTLALINGGLSAALAPLLVASMALAERHGIGIAHWLQAPTGIGALAAGLLAIVLFDLWMYWWHRANHEIALLWRLHQVHHTDPAMDATTALRFHPGELLLSSLLNALVLLVLGMGLTELTLYKSAMLAVILLHHSNVRLPQRLDAALRRLIVPPSMHRVHHSRIPHETNSNYGTIFSFWDRLFTTFRLRADPRAIVFGTGHLDGAEWQTVPRLLQLPLAPVRPPSPHPETGARGAA